MNTSLSKLSRHLFWDVDISTLSIEKHRRYIITRVVERGNCDDIKYVWKIYGPEMVKDVLVNARFLNRKNISYFANLFGISADEFRAYTAKEAVGRWNY